jgi:hypothetical protein
MVEVFNEKKHQIFNVEILSMIIPHIKGKKIFFDVTIEGKVRLLESWNIPVGETGTNGGKPAGPSNLGQNPKSVQSRCGRFATSFASTTHKNGKKSKKSGMII